MRRELHILPEKTSEEIERVLKPDGLLFHLPLSMGTAPERSFRFG